MIRMLFGWTLAGLVIVASGCAMCAHPYDECYPTYTGGCDGVACQGPRAGSIRAMEGHIMMEPREDPMMEAPPVPDPTADYNETTAHPGTAPHVFSQAPRKPSMPWQRQWTPLSGLARSMGRLSTAITGEPQGPASLPPDGMPPQRSMTAARRNMYRPAAMPRAAALPAPRGAPPGTAQQDRGGPDVWQMIPEADRQTAKVLSVTDRRMDGASSGMPSSGMATQPSHNPLR